MKRSAEQIKAEIARLQAQIPDIVTEGEYNGRPVLQFEGAGKPFSLGAGKLRRIMQHEGVVKAFIAKHK